MIVITKHKQTNHGPRYWLFELYIPNAGLWRLQCYLQTFTSSFGKQTVRISLLSNVVNVYRYTIYFKYNTNYSPIPNRQFSNKTYLWTVNKFILRLCKVISRVGLLTEKKLTNPIPAVLKWSNSSYIKREYIDVINHVLKT